LETSDGNSVIGMIVGTASVNEERNEHWIRFNRTDGDNATFLYAQGSEVIHGFPVRFEGCATPFALWWLPGNNPPYLQLQGRESPKFTMAGRAFESCRGATLEPREKLYFEVRLARGGGLMLSVRDRDPDRATTRGERGR